MWLSYWLSDKHTKGRLHGSALAILTGVNNPRSAVIFGGLATTDARLVTAVSLLRSAPRRGVC